MGHRREQLRELDRLLDDRNSIRRRMTVLENRLFKIESRYINITAGSPIIRSIEYYVNGKLEKKKTDGSEDIRMFAMDYPHSRNKA